MNYRLNIKNGVTENLLNYLHEKCNKKTVTKLCSRSTKQLFLKPTQNSQEGTCAETSFLMNFQAFSLQLYLTIDSSMFSGKFCEIFNNVFSIKQFHGLTPPTRKFLPTPPTPKFYRPTQPTQIFHDATHAPTPPTSPRNPRNLADCEIYVKIFVLHE